MAVVDGQTLHRGLVRGMQGIHLFGALFVNYAQAVPRELVGSI